MSAFSIRNATAADGDAILALMPRLAEFDLPDTRNPEHLWQDDANLLRRWMNGDEDCLVHVASSEEGVVVGFTLVRMRPELLSHAPSAHLEAIAIASEAEGKGAAQALLKAAETAAREAGAESMTLHVFARNERARRFYDRAGYDGELMRYIKYLDTTGQG